MSKTRVAVLGATGMIGQRFVQLLEDHPWFEIEGLYASERSDGKKLKEVIKVKDYSFMPETLGRTVEHIDTKKIAKNCRAAFSGLPSEIAKDYEQSLADAGVAVFSNAGSHRMREDVPLLIPEVNPEHLKLIEAQPSYQNGGYIVTNANCSTTGLAVPAKALQNAFGLQQVIVSTYQAVSGAGYPGVPSLDIIGNVIPFIKGEEEKMEAELHKMLGTLEGTRVKNASFGMLANCARVPVHDGHLESAVILPGGDCTCEEAMAAMRAFRPEPQKLELPTAPQNPIIVREEADRPQPLWDLNAGVPERARGMSVTVGRLRKKDKYLKMFLISHNTIRGGAGGSVLNAELAMAKGVLK
ncbi:MAG TPA: aspartate-semialdehyde dehydrogenase [Methanomassiliicoccales archaeon]|nr:aspartate-semialdehyde dehydrogenase [Methanomassiliicoccales archaeon]